MGAHQNIMNRVLALAVVVLATVVTVYGASSSATASGSGSANSCYTWATGAGTYTKGAKTPCTGKNPTQCVTTLAASVSFSGCDDLGYCNGKWSVTMKVDNGKCKQFCALGV